MHLYMYWGSSLLRMRECNEVIELNFFWFTLQCVYLLFKWRKATFEIKNPFEIKNGYP